MIIKRKEANI